MKRKRKSIDDWLATRPPEVQKLARRFPVNVLYNLKGTWCTIIGYTSGVAPGAKCHITGEEIPDGSAGIILGPVQVSSLEEAKAKRIDVCPLCLDELAASVHPPQAVPLTVKDLDNCATSGCQAPGCDHAHHDGTIFLNGACHPDTSSVDLVPFVLHDVQYVRLNCIRCKTIIVEIALAAPFPEIPTHADCLDFVKCSYTLHSGQLAIHCWQCGEILIQLPVLPAYQS